MDEFEKAIREEFEAICDWGIFSSKEIKRAADTLIAAYDRDLIARLPVRTLAEEEAAAESCKQTVREIMIAITERDIERDERNPEIARKLRIADVVLWHADPENYGSRTYRSSYYAQDMIAEADAHEPVDRSVKSEVE